MIRLWPERPDHAWCYDCMQDRTHHRVRFRMLILIDKDTLRVHIDHMTSQPILKIGNS